VKSDFEAFAALEGRKKAKKRLFSTFLQEKAQKVGKKFAGMKKKLYLCTRFQK